MKRFVFFLFVLTASLSLHAQSVETVDYPCARYFYYDVPTKLDSLYVYDSVNNYFDVLQPAGSGPGEFLDTVLVGLQYCEFAKCFYTDHPIKIYGIVDYVLTNHEYILHYYGNIVDTVASHSQETLRLYKPVGPGQLELLAQGEVYYDQPAYKIRVHGANLLPNCGVSYYVDTLFRSYEVYFDKPVDVVDSFYLSVTCNTRAQQPVSEDYPESPNGRYYVTPFFHWNLEGCMRRCPLRDLYDLPKRPYLLNTNTGSWDTVMERHIPMFFPIIDTLHHTVDTLPPCPAPGNLRLLNRTNHNAMLTWDGNAASPLYQLSCGPLGSDPDSTIVAEQYSNVATVSDLDTGIYYVARVRSQCHHLCADHDTLYWSPWGDSVLFYLGDHEPQSIDPAHADPSVTLQPNPASDRVTLSAASPIVSVEAFTASGVCCHHSAPHATSATLDLSSWPAGLYTLRITTSRGTAFRPLVVQ